MQESRGCGPQKRQWIDPDQNARLQIGAIITLHVGLIALAGLLWREAYHQGIRAAAIWLVASVLAGVLTCVITVAWSAFVPRPRRSRVIKPAVVMAIAQVVALTIGWATL